MSESATATDSILVVTDDRDLKFALRKRGARTAGSAWLIGRLDRPRLSSPSVGNRRPPAPPRVPQQQAGRGDRRRPTKSAGTPAAAPRRSAATRKRRPRGATPRKLAEARMQP